MKKRITTRMVWMVLLYPFIVGYTDPTPSKKGIVDLVLGFGNFMNINYSGCGGDKTVIANSFTDFGVDIRTKGEIVHGVIKGGYMHIQPSNNLYRSSTSSNTYTNSKPQSQSTGFVGAGFEIDESWVGFTLGAILFTEKTSTISSTALPFFNLRLGGAKKFNTTIGFLNTPTSLSNGGPLDIMIGFPVNSDGSSTVGLGIGGGIYQSMQLKLRLNITPSESKIGILINGNYGSIEGYAEYGMSVGLRFMY
jgi:hypothetical protein